MIIENRMISARRFSWAEWGGSRSLRVQHDCQRPPASCGPFLGVFLRIALECRAANLVSWLNAESAQGNAWPESCTARRVPASVCGRSAEEAVSWDDTYSLPAVH